MEYTLSAGTVIDDRYEIISLAGTGGMGSVFRAKHLELGKVVAIKTLDPLLVSDPELFERFKREARVLSRLKHPHISSFFSYGVLPTKLPYIAMEYLEGESLACILGNGAMAPERAIQITLQICAAMDYAHKLGVIHRDLKPQNIFLQPQPEPDYVKLLDFGLAKYAQKDEQVLTKTGELIGTPEYLSPEQCLGRKADERSDIYSLACILYHMLTGRSPFESESAVGFLAKHINEVPANPQRSVSQPLPEGLALIVMKGLEKDPQARQQTMAELSHQLALVLDEKGGSLNIKISDEYRGKKKSISKKVALVSLCGLACIAAIAFFVLGSSISNNRNTKAQSIEELIRQVDKANRDKDKANLESSTAQLENAIKLNDVSPINRAKSFCDAAEQLQQLGVRDPAIQMARLAFAEITSARSNFSRGNASRLGPASPMVDKFLDDNNVAVQPELQNNTDHRREAITTALGQITERASAVLVRLGYAANKKIQNQCCQQLEHLRTPSVVFENTAQLLIDSYQHGQMPLSTCILSAFMDRDVVLLRKGARDELSRASAQTETLLKKFYGNNSPRVALHHFNLANDLGAPTDLHRDEYERGIQLLKKHKYGKENYGSARVYLVAGNAAGRMDANSQRSTFYKLAYSSLQDEHNAIDRGQIIKSLSDDRLANNDYAQVVKFTTEGLEYLEHYPDPSYLRADLTLNKALALLRTKKVDTACALVERERQLLRTQVPESSVKLAILLQQFASNLRAEKTYFGKSQLAHDYFVESMENFKLWYPNPDRMRSLSLGILYLMTVDTWFGTGTDMKADWKLLDSIPEDSWSHALHDLSITMDFGKCIKQQKLTSVVDAYQRKLELVATQQINSADIDVLAVAHAIKILRTTDQTERAESLKDLALKRLPEKAREEFLREQQ